MLCKWQIKQIKKINLVMFQTKMKNSNNYFRRVILPIKQANKIFNLNKTHTKLHNLIQETIPNSIKLSNPTLKTKIINKICNY